MESQKDCDDNYQSQSIPVPEGLATFFTDVGVAPSVHRHVTISATLVVEHSRTHGASKLWVTVLKFVKMQRFLVAKCLEENMNKSICQYIYNLQLL